MLAYQLSFNSPCYLTLLALLPVVWVLSWRSLTVLGSIRRGTVLGVRGLIMSLLILALAEAQMVWKSHRVTVIYLLDQSLSIPTEKRQTMMERVNASIRKHRRQDDRAGVVVFGRDAAVEMPPFSGDVHLPAVVETPLDLEHTNLAAAMRLALACFPEDSAKRIVVVSDGNENLGDALKQSQQVANAGVGVDVAPVGYHVSSDVVVERVAVPSDVRRGRPFEVRVVMTNTTEPSDVGSIPVRGRLILSGSAGGQSWIVGEEPVVLPPGKKVFTIRQQIDEAHFYTYEARFVPDRPEDDAKRQNNRATGFAFVRGSGRVLLIEDSEHPGECESLVRQLRREGLDVTVCSDSELFSTLAELQSYDAVLLANVPRERFTDRQIAMLARNTRQLGAGLVMLGGPNSFGAGGWTSTEVEEAMPVDFQILDAKVVPVGALVLVIDRSGSMAGQKVEMCKAAALASAKTLGARDYVGVVTFDSAAAWTVPMTRAGSFEAITRRVKRIGAGGGTNMRPGMELGFRGVAGTDASVKHMIVLSDGQTMGQGYEGLASRLYQEKITISTVAVGPDADVALLGRIATHGGGKFYRVVNPQVLPRIFMKEARRVARPLVFDRHPVQPRVAFPHEMLNGIEGPLPPINGFVLTTRKESPLVEVSLVSPEPSGERNATILASWQYGLGRAVAFTSDAGARWTSPWTQQPTYGKLFTQVVRWSMRPSGATGKFTVTADVDGQRVRVVISALDKDDAYLNFLSMSGNVLDPELARIPLTLKQVAPGRYLGEFPAERAGPYFISVSPGKPGSGPILCGVNVPVSGEFRDRTANEALLERLAATAPKEGGRGVLVEAEPNGDGIESLAAVDTFRREGLPKTSHSRDVWHQIVFLASCLFFLDVFVRRVQVRFVWLTTLASRVRAWASAGTPQPAGSETIGRLRSRKAEVVTRVEQLRSAARFQLPSQPRSDVPATELSGEAASPEADAGKPSLAEESKEEESYTERLLRAKRELRQQSDDSCQRDASPKT